MIEKRKPHFSLVAIKLAFADPGALNRTFTAKRGAMALGMSDDDVVATVQSLVPAELDKSMTSFADNKIWQDVYRPSRQGRDLYVKFTLDAQGALLLISFKEA